MNNADLRNTVLLVEDDVSLRTMLMEELEERDCTVMPAGSLPEARTLLENTTPDLVVTDLRLPGENGEQLLKELRAASSQPAVLIITAFGSIPQAVACLKEGADDFLTKPLDMDHFLAVTDRVLETRRLRLEVDRFRDLIGRTDFHGMIGASPVMKRLFQHIRQMASAGGPVLIMGESGTGKELVAKAIHQESDRKRHPFIAVNCAGLPEHLVESELFGHEAGAFTGATRKRPGLFARADGGVLFLDEIGELPLSVQAKFLRVLQDGSIRPVGSNREQQVDVRVFAATNRSLGEMVQAGDFREDLYFRLETFGLTVPPLRERGEDDLDILAGYFLQRYSLELNKPIEGFSAEAMQCLKAYSFPGNVRELANAVERAVTFAHGEYIQPEAFPDRIRKAHLKESPPTSEFKDHPPELVSKLLGDDILPTLKEMEDNYIRYVLERVGGNKRRAAALLGIGRRTLYRRLEIPFADEE